MSENVIEQRIKKYACLGRGPNYLPLSQREVYQTIAAELQAVTDPCQFMPQLAEWPEDAEWCAVRTSGPASFFRHEPIPMTDGNWHPDYDDDFVSADWGVPDIPLGIDWRTLKVSRQQMKAWEAEND